MNTVKAVPLFSPEFVGLQKVFYELEPPYRLGDILRFNRAYQPIYTKLASAEKRRAEEFVDALVAGVERREWAARIFGVV